MFVTRLVLHLKTWVEGFHELRKWVGTSKAQKHQNRYRKAQCYGCTRKLHPPCSRFASNAAGNPPHLPELRMTPRTGGGPGRPDGGCCWCGAAAGTAAAAAAGVNRLTPMPARSPPPPPRPAPRALPPFVWGRAEVGPCRRARPVALPPPLPAALAARRAAKAAASTAAGAPMTAPWRGAGAVEAATDARGHATSSRSAAGGGAGAARAAPLPSSGSIHARVASQQNREDAGSNHRPPQHARPERGSCSNPGGRGGGMDAAAAEAAHAAAATACWAAGLGRGGVGAAVCGGEGEGACARREVE